MKYSLMSLMIDSELKIKNPSFIHITMAKSMGFEGNIQSLDEIFSFLNEKGIPIKNGTMEFEDYVKFAKENGYDGIDMMSFHFEEDGHEAKKILDKYGITLSAVNAIIPFVNSKTEEKFNIFYNKAKEVIDQAYDAGCRNILLMPTVYRAEEGITREIAFKNMVKGLKACIEYGESKGMTINTETMESIGVPLCSTGEMFRMFSELPSLKYTHDTGNPVCANEDPLNTYELFKNRLVAVHFKDLKYTDKKTDMMTPYGEYLERADFGTGVIDFKEHLKRLKKDGYNGFITLEGTLPADNPLDSAKKSIKYFKDLEKELEKDLF